MTSARRAGRSRTWFPLTHLSASLLLGVVLLVGGALLGRGDLAALGVAPLVTAAWAWSRHPRESIAVELRAPTALHTDRGLTAPARILAPTGARAARLRASSPGTEADEAVVRLVPGRVRSLALRTTSARTGAQPLFRLDTVGLGTAVASATDIVTLGPVTVLVLPGERPLAELPLPFRLHGMVGPHSSRRIGDGTELHDVAPFRPGDRLRRIDWRASARRGMQEGRLQELYVRRTQAPAEATVMLVIDSRDEVGPDVTTWAGARPIGRSDVTSLDIAREAAASVARAYLAAGDRVGLEDLGRRQRPVPPSGGRRHAERVVRRLALSVPEPFARGRVRPPVLPSGALVVLLSTFLDDEAMSLALTWRHTGHRVEAVDVLPPVRGEQLGTRQLMAYRMVEMQRVDRLTVLRHGGVEVVRWAADGPPPAGGPARLAALARGRHGMPR